MALLVEKRSNERKETKIKKKSTGNVSNDEGIPYNYMVVIDAGSKGSRAYIYSWLSTEYMLVNGKLNDKSDEPKTISDKLKRNFRLVKKFAIEDYQGQLPKIETGYKWYKKIKPGMSEFNENSSRIGPKYLSHLLKKIHDVIPIEQHYRTPLFVHATAGMRLLKPNEQDEILNNVCYYLQKETNFYIPDCQSHVSIIDGDTEGLYGWIALNYLTNTLDTSTQSVGLLEMGGASTQISFQPNSMETEEHSNQMIKLQLSTLGSEEPDLIYDIYSTSFLGYGISQIHLKYLNNLEKGEPDADGIYKILDPCLPSDYSELVTLDQQEYLVVGQGNYEKCNSFIYPLIVKDLDKCDVSSQQEVSTCLLSDAIPLFDFDIENFYGVSGYWDTMSNLLDLDDKKDYKDYGKIYSYDEIEKETNKICSLSWSKLKSYKDLEQDELVSLCFKSTYLTNLLHNGLGLNKKQGESSNFRVNDRVNGSEFTWTLGRALLYSSDESSIEYSNFLNNQSIAKRYPQVGYYHNSSPGLFIRGSEADGISLRPAFELFDSYESPGFLRYLDDADNDFNDSKDTYIVDKVDKKSFFKKHIWTSIFFAVVLLLIAFCNKSKVLRLLAEFFTFFTSLYNKFIKKDRSTKIHWPLVSRKRYKRLRSLDLELNDVGLENVRHEISDSDYDPNVVTVGSSSDNSNRASGNSDRGNSRRVDSDLLVKGSSDGVSGDANSDEFAFFEDDADDDASMWGINDVIGNEEMSDFEISDDDSDDGIERVAPIY